MIEKVYVVEFMRYTNCMRDTVSDWKESDGITHANSKYITIGKEPFLVMESELEKYRMFGGGFRKITFVGNIYVQKE